MTIFHSDIDILY